MIKKVDVIPKTVDMELEERRKRIRDDIREIIDNHIEKCEITVDGYKRSTWRERVQQAIRHVCWEIGIELKKEVNNIFLPKLQDCFNVTERKDKESGESKLYIIFNIKKYDLMIKEYKEESRKEI